MNFLNTSLPLCGVAWLSASSGDILDVVCGVSDLDLPKGVIQTQRDREDLRARAFHRLVWKSTILLVLWSACLIYNHEHTALKAVRDAAQRQPLPWYCERPPTVGDDRRRPIQSLVVPAAATWTETFQSAYYVWDPVARERECADLLARRRMDVWPNPIYVVVDTLLLAPMRAVDRVADTVGHAVSSFLGHFGYLVQAYILVLVPLLFFASSSSLWWPVVVFLRAVYYNYFPPPPSDAKVHPSTPRYAIEWQQQDAFLLENGNKEKQQLLLLNS